MTPKQHISMYMERLAGALLPSGLQFFGVFGSWQLDRLISRFFVELNAPAGYVAIHATKCPAMRNRVGLNDARKA